MMPEHFTKLARLKQTKVGNLARNESTRDKGNPFSPAISHPKGEGVHEGVAIAMEKKGMNQRWKAI